MKRSYPLTAVEKVEYDNTQNSLLFKLVFSTYTLSLQAESEEDARDWVEKINDGEQVMASHFSPYNWSQMTDIVHNSFKLHSSPCSMVQVGVT